MGYSTSTRASRAQRVARPLGLALAATMVFAPASALINLAHAQDGDGEDQQATPPISLIDSARTTTLTINKIEGDPEVGGQAGTGNKPMSGIVFDIYQLSGLNPANAADWETYADLDSKTMAAGEGRVPAVPVETVTTGADGSATTRELPVGFYFVKEQASAGVVPAPPFLISLPMTDQATLTDWDYHPSVKPKNQTLELIKTVTDQDIIEGKELTYTLEGGVPALATAGGSFDRFVITDDFDQEHTAINDATHQVRLVVPDGEGVQALETLTRVADYEIVNDNDKVAMRLTSSGLSKLEAQRGGNADQLGEPELKVEWSFDAEITGFNEDEGLILNNATLTPPRAPNVEAADIPSNTVTTEMIKINLSKLDGDTADELQGAEFDLYRCAPGTNDLLDDTVLDSATTDSAGVLSFISVQIPDFANGADRDPAWGYCVVETKAPEGYELIPEPVMVDLAGIDAGTNTITVEIENWKENSGNPLPVTGGEALLWLAGGVGVITLGGAVYVMRRRNDVSDVV